MARTAPKNSNGGASNLKDHVIKIRASSSLKALLLRAASLRGQTLSMFILASSRREAENAILGQRLFVLYPPEHDRFLTMLDAPSAPSEGLNALMQRKPVWES